MSVNGFSQATSLKIIAVDPNSAIISNIKVRLRLDNKVIKEKINKESKETIIDGIKSGNYLLEIEAAGFEPQTREIKINSGINNITLSLQVAEIKEEIVIDRDGQERKLDPQEGAFNNFLTRDEIESLPEDPQELERELKRRFGEDAVIQVDGFTSGGLPPKSQIASIRISRTSFDAEYHKIGNTIISVTSRAGDGKWAGSISFNFNDESLNGRDPFSLRRFPTQLRNFSSFFSGPLFKDKSSLLISLFGNNLYKQNNIIAVLPNSKEVYPIGSSSNSFNPWIKLSHNLSKISTLNINYNGTLSRSKNQGVGNLNLPERAFSSKIFNHQLRIYESSYIGKQFLNEIRLQYTDETTKNNPLSDKTTIFVLDTFNDGGSGNKIKSRRQSVWLSDNLLFGLGKIHALKIGGLLEYEKRNTESAINQNGTFIFSSLNDYVLNKPATFTQSLGIRNVNLSQYQISAYIQDDIRLHRSFMLSAGLRYEWQNNLKDNTNFSPRLGFTWSPYKTGKMTFRGGAGVYYNWLETNNLATVLSQNITQPNTTVIINPSYPNPFLSGISQILPQSYWQLAANLKNPYTFLSSIGMESQLNKTTSLRVLYKYQKGSHQFRSRDINAPLDGLRLNSNIGRIVQVESSAFFVQNSLNIGLNGRLIKKLSYGIDYTLAKNTSDADGMFGLPSNNYNLRIDRSVSNLDQRHRIYASLYWKPRKDVTLSTNLIINSPLPYTITTGFDENGDTVFNDRPFEIRRNSERGTWQKQVDMSLSWTIGLFKRKDGQSGVPGTILVSSTEAASGDIGIDQNHKYSLKLYTTTNNVFNQTNFINFVGVQTSPFFRQPIAANNPRRIEFGLRFSF